MSYQCAIQKCHTACLRGNFDVFFLKHQKTTTWEVNQRNYSWLTQYCHSLFSVTCNYGSNKCFYSCQQTDEARNDEFRHLINNETLANCPTTSEKMRLFNEQVNAKTNVNQAKAETTHAAEFLSAGLWLTTLVFLSLTITFAVISGLFSIFNTFWNPASFLFSTFGLYIWNGIAAALCLLTMIFWGSLYLIFISKNIAITDTLRTTATYSSNDLAGLGFSYWILLVTIFLHLGNILLVIYRNYLLQREPKAPVITVSKNDSTILVY